MMPLSSTYAVTAPPTPSTARPARPTSRRPECAAPGLPYVQHHCSSYYAPARFATSAAIVQLIAVQTLTITEASTFYRASATTVSRTGGYDVSATIQETCELRGTTAAVCTATLGGAVAGTTTSASVSGTLSGTDYYRFDVAITAGAEKTASPTGQCGAAGAKGSGASTKAVAMWGLVGVVGVASLLGF